MAPGSSGAEASAPRVSEAPSPRASPPSDLRVAFAARSESRESPDFRRAGFPPGEPSSARRAPPGTARGGGGGGAGRGRSASRRVPRVGGAADRAGANGGGRREEAGERGAHVRASRARARGASRRGGGGRSPPPRGFPFPEGARGGGGENCAGRAGSRSHLILSRGLCRRSARRRVRPRRPPSAPSSPPSSIPRPPWRVARMEGRTTRRQARGGGAFLFFSRERRRGRARGEAWRVRARAPAEACMRFRTRAEATINRDQPSTALARGARSRMNRADRSRRRKRRLREDSGMSGVCARLSARFAVFQWAGASRRRHRSHLVNASSRGRAAEPGGAGAHAAMPTTPKRGTATVPDSYESPAPRCVRARPHDPEPRSRSSPRRGLARLGRPRTPFFRDR